MGKKPGKLAPKWQYIGLGALALATAGSVSFALADSREQPPVSDAIASYAASAPAQPTREPARLPATARPAVAAAVGLLNDPAREWNMTLLGDSTGNDINEFTFILAQQMTVAYNRPVIVHRWTDGLGYSEEKRFGFGGGAPIHIWNGSAPGKTGGYAVDNLKVIAPAGSDLTIVNYGHNYKATWGLDSGMIQLVQSLDQQNGPTPMLFILQNPQHPETPGSAAIVERLRTLTSEGGYEVVDVYKAFKDAGDIAPLMLDSIHPNPAGSKVWADAVAAKLGVTA